ncbi:FAD:protein FMN transferase [Bradyrhizobium sp.]|uniref:FAD:protein FMN transferase n=1 Tax=Bradyrhizobium sp. TaxID=376 RepID=UPI0025B9CD7E|nr:FAD:protein FMN transferase [Bradyrhizobium sp.]
MTGGAARPREADYEWRGVAMGADATILFNGIEPQTARSAIAAAVAEIDRLEHALSLFRDSSELRRLNRDKVLHSPSSDMRRALALGLDIADRSGGLFDPSVQALWEAHVDWFAVAPEAGLPPEGVIAQARAAVDWRRIRIGPDTIRAGGDQRLTLNGLGQGYVTDRVADLLHFRGFKHILVDLGEQRAVGPRRGGAPWLVARANAAPFALTGGALATSEGAGCMLGASGTAHHLFDPRSGRSAAHWKRITVHHRSAAVADALSTALYAASAGEIEALLPRFKGTAIWGTDHDNRERRWISPPVDVTLR